MRTILLIVCFYMIFFVAIPPFQSNDEPDHFQYIYYLAQGIYPKIPDVAGLVVFDPSVQTVYDIIEVVSNDYHVPNFKKIQKAVSQNIPFSVSDKTKPLTYQAHHPPLYFTAALLFFLPSYKFTQGLIPTYYATRLISCFFFILSVYIAWLIAKILIKNRKTAQYLVAVFAINPVMLKMGVSINPDIASTAIGLATLWFVLSTLQKKIITKKIVLFLISILSCAVYIKFQNIVYLFFSFIFFCTLGVRMHKPKRFALFGVFVILIVLILYSPWLFHSFYHYRTFLPSSFVYTFFCTANLPHVSWFRIPLDTLLELRHSFYHFAGFLGWGEPYPFSQFFFTYALFFMVFIFLGAIYVYKTAKNLEWRYMLLYAICVCLFFLAVSFTYKINRYSCDVQGRYLLAALFPFILLAWKGLCLIRSDKKEFYAKALYVFAVWQYFFILCYVLIPRYYV